MCRRYVSVDSSGRKSSVDESGDSTVSLNMKARTFAASKRSNINARYGFWDHKPQRMYLIWYSHNFYTDIFQSYH